MISCGDRAEMDRTKHSFNRFCQGKNNRDSEESLRPPVTQSYTTASVLSDLVASSWFGGTRDEPIFAKAVGI